MPVESADAEGAVLSLGGIRGEFELSPAPDFILNPTFESSIAPAFPDARKPVLGGSLFDSWCEGLLEAFGLVGSGAIMFGADGLVMSTNPAAERMFGSGIALANGQLVATDRASNTALQGLLLAMKSPRASRAGQRIAIARPGAPPLLGHAISIDRLSVECGHASGLLVLVDPLSRREPTAAVLQQVFSLTPAEARLASGLAKGLDLQEISDLHGVSVGTLRVQLKSVFSKTQTKRQAQLVVLLARLVF
jgi:DNA-binding CsgD family transcriptional regulator